MNIPDRFQPLSLDVMIHVFPEELAYIHEYRFELMDKMPEILTLLSANMLSHWHVWSIHQKIEENKAALAKQEEDKARKVRDPASLTGSHRY